MKGKTPDWIKPLKDPVFGDGVEVLGKRFHYCSDYAIFSMEDIRDRYLCDLWELMDASFNCAHNEKFCYHVVLLKRKRGYGKIDLLVVHDHLEDFDMKNVTALTRVMSELQEIGTPYVELLDNFWEKLMIRVSSAPFKFTKIASEVKCTEFDYGDDS